MTPRARFITALERRPLTGRVPHFELGVYLTMELFGKVYPNHRSYHQWLQMEEKERQLHRLDIADVFIRTAERFDHSAILMRPKPDEVDETMRLTDIIRERTGDTYFLMRHGDATFAIPDGAHMAEFSYRIYDDPQSLKDEAQRLVDRALEDARVLARHGGLDGLRSVPTTASTPVRSSARTTSASSSRRTWKATGGGYRELGFYVIKHTDGSIMPILDYLLDANPHAPYRWITKPASTWRR
ncbi:MAG: hypothetical protein R2851_24855 [Caldilineaceae bacterium]